MGIEEGTTNFTLSRGVDYSRGGNSQNHATMVLLKEPSMDHTKFYMKLKQMLMRCQMEFAKQANDFSSFVATPSGEEQKSLPDIAKSLEDETDELAETFETIIMASETVDASEFVETFRKMVTSREARPTCLLDECQTITPALWNKLRPDDAFKMAVRWCIFFGIPSDVGGKITSGQPSDSLMEPKEA